MSKLDNVIDFKEIRKIKHVSEILGETFVITKVVMGNSFAYIEVERSGHSEREEYKVRGKVLLKQLKLLDSYIKNGAKVRVTLMKRVSRNGMEYYLFV